MEEQYSDIERTQQSLRDSIEAAKRLWEQSDALIDKHRQEGDADRRD